MGVSGTPVYAGYVLTPERSPKLIGQEKYRTYSHILANTSIVAAGVRYFLNIVAKPSWSCEPADKSDEAKKYAEFVEHVLDDLHTPWSRVVRRCGTYRFHGFAIQEWTAKRRDDGKIGFHDIESRPQWTIWRWEVDERGTVTGAWQRDPLTGRELGLPRGKVMYLCDDTLTDSPEGMGLMRHCVEPATRLEQYMKQEAYGYLRDLHGVPVGRAPMDELASAVQANQITQTQMDTAIENLKKFCAMEEKTSDTAIVLNSQPYIDVTDSGNTVSSSMKWDVQLLNGGAPGLVPVGQAIVRINTEIARILGVEHLLLGADAAGSYALAKEKASDLYLLANSVVNDIGLQSEHDLIWPLWALNGFPDKMMPHLKHEDVQPKDVEQISRVLRDLSVAGAPLQPDDEVQNFLRDLLGAPHVDLQKLQQQMEEQQQQQEQQLSALSAGGGSGAGAPQPRVPTTDQEQSQEAATAKRADDLLDIAYMAKEQVDGLIRKSSNGSLPALREISAELDDIIEKATGWDESKHPRDPRGEFSSGGGGGSEANRGKIAEALKRVFARKNPINNEAWWHGTASSFIDSIRKNGLAPPEQTKVISSAGHALYGHIPDYKSSVFMTNDFERAKVFADSAAGVQNVKALGRMLAGNVLASEEEEEAKPVILRLRLNDEQRNKLVVDEADKTDQVAGELFSSPKAMAELEKHPTLGPKLKSTVEGMRSGKIDHGTGGKVIQSIFRDFVATKPAPPVKQFRLAGTVPSHLIDVFKNGKWVALAEEVAMAIKRAQGQHIFYVVVPIVPPGMHKWDESQHPRDWHGRFGSGGGGGKADGGEKPSAAQKSEFNGLVAKAKKSWGDIRPFLGTAADVAGQFAFGAAAVALMPALPGGVLAGFAASYALSYVGPYLEELTRNAVYGKPTTKADIKAAQDRFDRNVDAASLGGATVGLIRFGRKIASAAASWRAARAAGAGAGRVRGASSDPYARPGQTSRARTVEDPAQKAVRMAHGLRAARVMARYLHASSPGEKEAARNVLRSMGVDVSKFAKMLKAKKFDFSVLDHLLTKQDAEKILHVLVQHMTAEQMRQLLDNEAYLLDPSKARIRKVVPYNEAAPYRDEDAFVGGTSGASDGPMYANPTFDSRRRLKPRGPNALIGEGSELNVGEPLSAQDAATQTAAREDYADEGNAVHDLGTPGARTRVSGRRRTL